MYCKLFSSLYQGTLRGKAYPILVFTNLLAHADKDGFVDKHFKAIAEEVGISIEEVKAAIAELEAPDTESRSQEFEGRRLLRIDEHRNWGWRIVNYLKYRSIRNEEDRREQNRNAQAAYRNRSKQSKPASAEVSQGKLQSAHTEEEAEEEADTSTPSIPLKGEGVSKRNGFDPLEANLPSSLDTPTFREALSDWVAHRREKRAPLTERSFNMQMRECEAAGVHRSLEAIRHSIKNGYQGLFFPNGNVNKRNVGVAGGDKAAEMGQAAQKKVDREMQRMLDEVRELQEKGEI